MTPVSEYEMPSSIMSFVSLKTPIEFSQATICAPPFMVSRMRFATTASSFNIWIPMPKATTWISDSTPRLA
jgi:hypothetical protein